jgi:PAS domain S-box-containing protein
VPFLLVGILAIWAADLRARYESPYLTMLLNIVFSALVGLFIAYLVGRTFLAQGTSGPILLGCGVLFWGAAGVVAPAFSGGDPNTMVTIHNCCTWLSAACHLTGVVTLRSSSRVLRGGGLPLVAAYLVTLAVIALIVIAAVGQWLPTFFVPGQGGTPLRQVVLGLAAIMFLLTAGLLSGAVSGNQSAFARWYRPAMVLIAIGLSGVMVQASPGTAVSWLGRGTQILGSIYMLLAALASFGETRAWAIPLAKALEEARQRYEDLLELAVDGILVHEVVGSDSRGGFIQYNQALCDLLGYRREEMRSLSLLDVIAPADSVEANEEPPAAGVGALRYETMLVAKDGRRIPVEIGTRHFHDGGRLLAMSVIRDITERRRAEQAIRESNDRYALVIAGAGAAIWDWDVPNRRVVYSPHWKAMRGLAEDEVSDRDEEWSSGIHPDDAPRVLAAVQAHFAGATPVFSEEYRVRCRDGSYKWVLDRGLAQRDAQGRVIRMAGSETDITARKRWEEQLHELSQRLTYHVEHSPLAVIEWGPDMRLARWSGAAERLFGWKAEEVLGKRIEELRWVYEQDCGKVENVSEGLQAGDGPCRFSANRNYRKDGSVVHCEWYNSSLLDERGNLRSILSLVLDVTDRKLTEQERARLLEAERAARVEAERAARLKDEFLATVSHELRNPLNAIVGWNRLLARGSVESARACEIIGKSAASLAQIVDDLLDMSRIISGKTQLKPERVDLAALVGSVLDGVRLAAQAKHIQVEASLDPRLEPTTCDPNRIQQVVHNLLSNAVKFTPEGGQVHVGVARSGGGVRIEVKDTGQGISPEFLPHVFDQFRQEDGSITRRHGGLGLGLTIVRHLVELHGGTVDAHSDGIGHGAVFAVWLPAMQSARPGDAESRLPRRPVIDEAVAAAAAEDGGTREALSLRGWRVLVIDDDPGNAELVARVLADVGAVSRSARSGEEGLEVVGEFQPDLVICDISMPGMNGYEFVRRIRGRSGACASLPCVALTAFARPEDRVEALRSGFNEHLAKPFNVAQLAGAMSRLTVRKAWA